jgi:hypothetical protein
MVHLPDRLSLIRDAGGTWRGTVGGDGAMGATGARCLLATASSRSTSGGQSHTRSAFCDPSTGPLVHPYARYHDGYAEADRASPSGAGQQRETA